MLVDPPMAEHAIVDAALRLIDVARTDRAEVVVGDRGVGLTTIGLETGTGEEVRPGAGQEEGGADQVVRTPGRPSGPVDIRRSARQGSELSAPSTPMLNVMLMILP